MPRRLPNEVDPRIKSTVTSTMYDMSRVNANGYFDAMSSDDRYKLREQLNAQRTEDYRDDSYVRDGGVLDPVTDDTPQFVKEYHDYYKTERGYHRRSPKPAYCHSSICRCSPISAKSAVPC